MNDIFGHQLVKVVKMKSTVLAHDTFFASTCWCADVVVLCVLWNLRQWTTAHS